MQCSFMSGNEILIDRIHHLVSCTRTSKMLVCQVIFADLRQSLNGH